MTGVQTCALPISLLDVENNNNISKQQSELLFVFEQLPKLEQELVLDYAKKALKIVKQTKEEEIKNKIKKISVE